MNKKNKKKARTEPVKYRFLTQKEDLMTPELIKEMRKHPYGSQHHKKIEDVECFAAFCLGTLTWYILEGVPWGKNDYLMWCIMIQPNDVIEMDITASYLNNLEIKAEGYPIVHVVGPDIDFKPCKLSEIKDDPKLQKYIAERIEYREQHPDDYEEIEPMPEGWYPDLWDNKEKAESMPQKLAGFFDVII